MRQCEEEKSDRVKEGWRGGKGCARSKGKGYKEWGAEQEGGKERGLDEGCGSGRERRRGLKGGELRGSEVFSYNTVILNLLP